MTLLAYIPSPSTGVVEIGGRPVLHAYGLMLALGILAAYMISTRRYLRAGGNPDDVWRVLIVCVPAGVVGARLYHVATDWKSFRGRWLDVFKLWEGGLGIWGGIALGALAGIVVARRDRLNVDRLLVAITPALPVAQAIGRVGNWWNQELFGKPTDVPWALKIDAIHRPAKYFDYQTFHPTFLYELVWCLIIAAILLLIDREYRLDGFRLFSCYVALYTAGRFLIEQIRVDDAYLLLGFRVNVVVSVIVFFAAISALILLTAAKDVTFEEEAADKNDSNSADDGKATESVGDKEVWPK